MQTPAFNLIAPFYDLLAQLVFGKNLRKAQLTYLAKIQAGTKILIIGGGSGHLLREIIKKNIPLSILYLEASDKMLALSKKMVMDLPGQNQITFRLGTEKDLGSSDKFDVIVANFFLDLFPEPCLRIILRQLNQSLLPGGLWLVTDFINPKGPLLTRWVLRFLLKGMYLFFNLVSKVPARSLPDWPKLLTEIAGKSPESSYFYHGLIRATYFIKV